jgi:hypothetical protein
LFFNLLFNYFGLSCIKFGIRAKFDQVLKHPWVTTRLKKKKKILSKRFNSNRATTNKSKTTLVKAATHHHQQICQTTTKLAATTTPFKIISRHHNPTHKLSNAVRPTHAAIASPTLVALP